MILGINPLMGATHNPGTLKTSLVAAWEFNDASGSLVDAHNSNDLDDYGTPAYGTDGKLGDSIGFDGSTDYFRETTSSNTFTPASAASYSIWVRSTGNADALSHQIMGKYYSGTGNRILLITIIGSNHSTLANRLLFQTYDSANTANICVYNGGGSNIWLDNWMHIACVRDGANNKLYVNAELVDSNTAGNGSGRQSTYTYAWFAIAVAAISSSLPDLYFEGDIDQSCVWSKALTEAEIKFLYNQGSGAPYSIW